MKITQIDTTDMFEEFRRRVTDKSVPDYRKHAAPLNKEPSDPKYPTKPFNHDEWMASSKKMEDAPAAPAWQVGQQALTHIGGRWIPCVITKPPHEETGNYGVRFKHAGKTFNTVSSVEQLKPMAESVAGGSFGQGINQWNTNNPVSYEHVLDEVENQVLDEFANWMAEQSISELSVDKMQAYKDKVASPQSFKTRGLGKLAKGVEGNAAATRKISAKMNQRLGGTNGTTATYEDSSPEEIAQKLKIRTTDVPALYALLNGKIKFNDLPQAVRFSLYNQYAGLPHSGPDQELSPGMTNKLRQIVAEQDMDEAYEGPWQGDPVKLAKSPKSSMQGSGNVRLSDLIKDSIDTHGVKWAFEYYVKKHGLPPRQFQILAGLTANPSPGRYAPKKQDEPNVPTPQPKKKGWWANMLDKFASE